MKKFLHSKPKIIACFKNRGYEVSYCSERGIDDHLSIVRELSWNRQIWR